MGLYKERILPHLVNLAMRNPRLQRYREYVTSAATGRVLEIGVGSGLNLALYPTDVFDIVGLDPVPRLLAMARRAANRSSAHVSFIEASAEAIPLETSCIDSVVTTWTLCTIPDVISALSEIRRVLRPTGQLLFVEHGLTFEHKIRSWQDRLTPLWKRIAGGCHLNRPIRDLIENAGFIITEIETGYIKGPKPMTFFYCGRARAV